MVAIKKATVDTMNVSTSFESLAGHLPKGTTLYIVEREKTKNNVDADGSRYGSRTGPKHAAYASRVPAKKNNLRDKRQDP